jgi:trehalose 6-phosphate phosphatase
LTLIAPENVKARIREAERLRLFLDYDGTLADFAPTPEHVTPKPEVIELLSTLTENPRIRVAVISGRPLEHVEKLLPVPGALLAGTYGVELRLPDGERVDRASYQDVRPVLKEIKARWKELLADQEGFFLEDKDWALAIHARYAPDDAAEDSLEKARRIATDSVKGASSKLFRVLGGHKFLEIGPTLAHKGRTVEHLLERYPWPDALLLYIGDDDKDEEAFGVIQAQGGIAIRVCEAPCHTQADGRLASPETARQWLATLVVRFDQTSISALHT